MARGSTSKDKPDEKRYVECESCGQFVRPQGLHNHRRACVEKKQRETEAAAREERDKVNDEQGTFLFALPCMAVCLTL